MDGPTGFEGRGEGGMCPLGGQVVSPDLESAF